MHEQTDVKLCYLLKLLINYTHIYMHNCLFLLRLLTYLLSVHYCN